MDSRTETDLELVEGVLINIRGHYTFENQNMVVKYKI